jgi:hypothetical protein
MIAKAIFGRSGALRIRLRMRNCEEFWLNMISSRYFRCGEVESSFLLQPNK